MFNRRGAEDAKEAPRKTKNQDRGITSGRYKFGACLNRHKSLCVQSLGSLGLKICCKELEVSWFESSGRGVSIKCRTRNISDEVLLLLVGKR